MGWPENVRTLLQREIYKIRGGGDRGRLSI